MDPAPKPRRFRGGLNAGKTEQNAVVKARGHGQAVAGGTRGEDLQELELEMHKGTSLPMHYNFELAKTAKRIRTLKATTVALQMPEGLLMFACSVGDALKKACDTLERCVVMSDATYGACCVDDRGAEAMGAQLLVHYGHSCLVPVDETRVPCMYVFVDIKFNVDHLVECVEQNFAVNEKLLVAGTIQFASSLQEAKLRWQRNGRSVEVPQSKPLSPGEVLGCTAPSMAADKELDAIVFVADGRFHLEAIMIANPTLPTYRYDPYAKVMTREYYDHKGMKDQRRRAVEEARESKAFGVVLGTLGRQGNPKVLEQIQKLLDSKGVEYMLFLADEISPEMIGTLVEEGCVDAFIQIACPRLSIDWGEGFKVPVLTPFEAFVAFGAAPAWWESPSCCSHTCKEQGCSKNEAKVQPYPMDYYAKDGGPWSSSYHRERKRTQASTWCFRTHDDVFFDTQLCCKHTIAAEHAHRCEMVREKYKYVIPFRELRIQDVPKVGGKNASLGEMVAGLAEAGVSVPDGFATTADAYWHFLHANEGLLEDMRNLLEGAEGAKLHRNVREFEERGKKLRQMVRAAKVPQDLVDEIKDMYAELTKLAGMDEDSEGAYVAVRSSATAEDLPNASFAGQQDSFLHVHGVKELIERWVDCCASLFTARAITYRHDMGFDHMAVALSVGVQIMVRSDTGSSGVMFTLDPESGFKDVVLVQGIYGLGENIVQGRVGPDEFLVHKPTLKQGFKPLVRKQCGPKEMRMVYNAEKRTLVNLSVPDRERRRLSVTDEEVLLLARWGMQIEEHYGNKPMDIEWAKDGDTGNLYIVQARPETIHSRSDINVYRQYTRKKEQKIPIEVLAEGIAVGNNIGYGAVRVIESPKQIDQFQPGEILVTSITDPAWDPILKDAGAIITERGGRTSHAAIVAREMGIPAIVGAEGARKSLSDGMEITVSCCEGDRGKIYKGRVDFSVVEIDVRTLKETKTKIMLNIARPDKALAAASLPCDGVGLCRMEFVFADHIGIHPLALTRFGLMPKDVQLKINKMMEGHGPYQQPQDFFVDMLAQGVGTLVAAFYPRPVILRMSDLKTNEYAQLVGGSLFEPKEENPMIGWRGASRYYHKDYKEGFMLEVEAVKKIREEFGLTNLKVMIPFCRTPEEGKKVIDTMAEAGLKRGDGLELYVMAEIPSNIWMAEEFSEHFDGFSIGSNDLTQLTLGIDRDAERIYPLFDECNKAVKDSCALLIQKAHAHDPPRKVGICGQAPSDHPDFAAFLVEQGIDTISLNTDAVVSTKQSIIEKEAALGI